MVYFLEYAHLSVEPGPVHQLNSGNYFNSSLVSGFLVGQLYYFAKGPLPKQDLLFEIVDQPYIFAFYHKIIFSYHFILILILL